MPHVLADDWGSLGFGQGYSATRDRGCIVADQVLKVRAERASFLGRGENDEFLNGDFGIVLLNGSDSRFEWADEAGARDAGVVPYAKQPHLERRDAVSNANQSHWIANSAEPLEGYTPLMGRERHEQHLRARVVALMVEEDTVDVAEACTVLEQWDLLYKLDSVGAVLWRQLWSLTSGSGYQWKVPFDVSDPLGTPRGLADAPAQGPDPVLQNLAGAVLLLEDADFEIDVALGDAQFTNKGDLGIPMHGGIGLDGVAKIAAPVIDFADSPTTVRALHRSRLTRSPRTPTRHATPIKRSSTRWSSPLFRGGGDGFEKALGVDAAG